MVDKILNFFRRFIMSDTPDAKASAGDGAAGEDIAEIHTGHIYPDAQYVSTALLEVNTEWVNPGAASGSKENTDTNTEAGTASGVSVTDFSIKCLKGSSDERDELRSTQHAISITTDVYSTDHKAVGHALIISQEKFSVRLKQEGFGDRAGNHMDENILKRTLESMGFQVSVYANITANQIRNVSAKMADKDHSDADCFVCVILSHGEEGKIFGTDKSVEIKELTSKFRGDRCPSLIGKPKLFFIQACRGYQTDAGVNLNVRDALPDTTDAPINEPQMIKLPIEADFLFAYSTVPGYYSWRNGMNGSWFIQALCNAMTKHGQTMELQKLLTTVNRIVAQEYQSCNPDNPGFHKMKQVSCIASMLTKDVYFKKKKKRHLLL